MPIKFDQEGKAREFFEFEKSDLVWEFSMLVSEKGTFYK